MKNFIITFPESKGMLNIADNFGDSVQLNPVQAMDLMDFLLRHAEHIRACMSTDDVEERAWSEFLKQSAVNGIGAMEISEAERLSLLEPTPFDAGVCKCGAFVEAGKLHEHKCLTWEEKERINDQERQAYCGYKD